MPLNKALLAYTVNQLVTDPKIRSVIGWVLFQGPVSKFDSLIEKEVAESLGLTPDDARYLFSPRRTISEVHRRASELINGGCCDKYDERGYDEYGRDRDGRDRDGYGRDGYNRFGRNRDGCDRLGRDRDGRDRLGYDENGIDQYGRDRSGGPLPLIVVDE